eukprot:1179196-Prorocentrum_minimum.AAC.8
MEVAGVARLPPIVAGVARLPPIVAGVARLLPIVAGVAPRLPIADVAPRLPIADVAQGLEAAEDARHQQIASPRKSTAQAALEGVYIHFKLQTISNCAQDLYVNCLHCTLVCPVFLWSFASVGNVAGCAHSVC